MILAPLQKLCKNVGDSGKLIEKAAQSAKNRQLWSHWLQLINAWIEIMEVINTAVLNK